MKTNSTFGVIFFTRKSRSNPDFLDIYVRITANRQRTEVSVKRSIEANLWDNAKGRAKGYTPDSRRLNAYLDEVYSQLLDCHNQLLSELKVITPDAIKKRFLGEDEQHKTLMQLVTYHNESMVHTLKPGTMKNYYTTEKYLKAFLREKLKVNDIYLKQLNYRFITDFEYYLRTCKPKTRKQQNNNGTMKHLERVRKMMNLALKLEWLEKDPFRKFQLKLTKADRQYLSEGELRHLEIFILKPERLEVVRDIFVFSCYTGLAYIDVKELTKDQILKGINGNLWIHTQRTKTNEAVKIPLLPKAKEILEKYRDYPYILEGRLLPVYSNQKVNSYLKEIMAICGIPKNITFHSARHTFATTVTLANGVPIETVSKLLGHTKLSTTQIYARVLEGKIHEDMQILEGKLMSKGTDKSVEDLG